MKTYRCRCGNLLFFHNSHCLNCDSRLGYVPGLRRLVSLVADAMPGHWHEPATPTRRYRLCENYQRHNVCNWVIDEHDPETLCQSCRLNAAVPLLGEPSNLRHWYRLEQSKRHLLFSLMALKLPVVGRAVDPDNGLAFAFLATPPEQRETNAVITGHARGLITINVAEADDVWRETTRHAMNEPYRTLIGHFRHESGHYYWEKLLRDSPRLEAFRGLFGDERLDYDTALARYYECGAASGWEAEHISAYATSHPWEDWAESWAHYLHMTDTLETAHDFGLSGKRFGPSETWQGGTMDVYGAHSHFDALIQDWRHLTVAMNSLAQSIGQAAFYPFHISPRVEQKLRFIHDLIHGAQ